MNTTPISKEEQIQEKISLELEKMTGISFMYHAHIRKILSYEFQAQEVWIHSQKKYKTDVHKIPLSRAVEELKNYRIHKDEKR